MAVSDVSQAKAKPDWLAIRREYETTAISQRKLAKLRNIPYGTLFKRAMREKWRQHAKSVKKTTIDLEAEINERALARVRDDLAPWIEEQKVKFTKRGFHLASNGISRVERMFDSDSPLDAKEESYISKAAETYHRMGRVALGMGDGSSTGSINLNILTNQAAVQVNSQS